jgi:ligand-binding sensor domain-containing protein
MRKTLSMLVLCALMLPRVALSQEYSYTHYGTTDGLAGSTVYTITQDKQGFIWLGTEAGVSRFDGTHFKNFTTRDGLPDLEVIKMFGDSKGRVWMAPFKKAICYFYKGSIHNEKNDPLLAQIRLKGNIHGFAEDAVGNILLHEKNALHVVYANNMVVNYDSLDHAAISECYAVSRSSSGHFLVQTDTRIVEFSGDKCIRTMPFDYNGDLINIKMSSAGIIWRADPFTEKIRLFFENKTISYPVNIKHDVHISFSWIDDSLVYFNRSSGSFEYNTKSGQTKRYLPGIAVSGVFKDAAGDTWFTTMGEGIFRLKSNEWKTIRLSIGEERSMVTSIKKLRNDLWLGDNHLNIFRYALPAMTLINSRPWFYNRACRILFIDTTKG